MVFLNSSKNTLSEEVFLYKTTEPMNLEEVKAFTKTNEFNEIQDVETADDNGK